MLEQPGPDIARHAGTSGSPVSRVLLAGGILQTVALFTPAVRVRIVGTVSFLRLPTAGAALLALGVLTILIAFRSGGWWRWLPAILTGAVLAIAYWRIVTAPSGSFIDPLLRHAVHPAWGFVAMGIAAAVVLVGAAVARPVAVVDPAPLP